MKMNITEMRGVLTHLLADLTEQDRLLTHNSALGGIVGENWELHFTKSSKALAAVSRSIDDALPGLEFGSVLGTDALTIARKGARLEAFHVNRQTFADWTGALDQPIHDIAEALRVLSRA